MVKVPESSPEITHLDETILVVDDGEVGDQAETGVQEGVVTPDPLVP